MLIDSGDFTNPHHNDFDEFRPVVGGIIYNNGKVFIGSLNSFATGNISLHDSQATSAGGAIFNNLGGTLTIGSKRAQAQTSRVSISNCAAPRGGAIYNNGGVVTIASNDFSISDNLASLYGGAIYSQGGKLKISRGRPGFPSLDAEISRNSAFLGGGIYDNDSQLSVSGVEMKGNSTPNLGSGAGVYIANDRVATITQSYIHDNAAFFGGGIVIPDGSVLSLTASTLAGNTSMSNGDGIDIQGSARITVLNSTFKDNGIDLGVSDTVRVKIIGSTIEGGRLGNFEGFPMALTLRNSILHNAGCDNISDRGHNLKFNSDRVCPGINADPALDPQGL